MPEKKNSYKGGGKKSFGDKKKFFKKDGESGRGESADRPKSKSYGDKPRFKKEGEGKTFGDKKKFFKKDGESGGSGERKSYGDKPRFKREGEGKSFGDKKKFFKKDGESGGSVERKSYGDKPRFNKEGGGSERKSYGDKPRFKREGEGKSFGDKKKFFKRDDESGSGERKSYGDKPRFNKEGGSGGRKSYGDKPRFKREGEGKTYGKSFGDKKRPFKRDDESGGERKSYGDKPRFNKEGGGSERKSYGDKPRFKREGEGKSFGDKKKFFKRDDESGSGERKSYGDKPRFNKEGGSGERKSYGDKPRFKREGEGKTYGKSFGDKKRPFKRDDESGSGERKSYGDKPRFNKEGGSGERKPYNKSFGDKKKFVKRDDESGSGERKSYGDKPRFNKEGGGGERKPYNKSFGDKKRPFKRDDESGGEGKSYEDKKKFFSREGDEFPKEQPKLGKNARKKLERAEADNEYEKKRSLPLPESIKEKVAEEAETEMEPSLELEAEVDNSAEVSGMEPLAPKGPALKKKTRKEKEEEKEAEEGQYRLNRFIALAGICSRREADALIAAGNIQVNGEVVKELGVKINPDKDEVKYNGVLLTRKRFIYILLNKPKGYITTTSDEKDRHTVMELISHLTQERVYPVGRLDRDTTGLLLLTNDGELTKKLTHPSYEVKKIYKVGLDREFEVEDMEKLRKGFELEDGFIKPDRVVYSESTLPNEIALEIHSGRNRIVRRMFEHLGYKIEFLDRVGLGPLSKQKLVRGKSRILNDKEVGFLKML